MDLPKYTYNRSEEAVSGTLLTHTIPADTWFDSSSSQQGTVDIWITKDIWINDACEWGRSIIPDHYIPQHVVQLAKHPDIQRPLVEIWSPALEEFRADTATSIEVFFEPSKPDIQRPLMEVWSPALEEFRADTATSIEVFFEPGKDDEYLTLYVRQFDPSFSQPGTVDLLMTKGLRMNDTCEWVKSIIQDNYTQQRVVQKSQEDDVLSFINDQAALDYLVRHPAVRRPLMEVWSAALKEFRPDAEISVELFSEPDEDDEYLTLYVRQEEYQDDILDRIDAIRAQLRRSPSANTGRVFLTTDFQPPH